MAQTSCKMVMDLTIEATKNESTVTNTSASDRGDIGVIKEVISRDNVGILEDNTFLLDGSLGNAEDDFKIGMWSSYLSQDNCEFAPNEVPTLIVTLPDDASAEAKKIYGMDFLFYEDYPDMMRIKFEGNAIVDGKTFTYYPNKLHFFASANVPVFKKATITFLKTRKPNQSIKLEYLTFGKLCIWENDDVIHGTVNEEIDITGATLPINTASVSILDKDNDFDVLTNGAWQYIKTNQKAEITEKIDGKEIPIGEFFVTTWNTKDNETTFEMNDAISLLDLTQYYGTYHENIMAYDLFEEVLEDSGVQYQISDVYRTMPLHGVLPTSTRREALQKVAFSVGAIVDTSRGSIIKVFPPDRNVDSYVMINRKFSGETTAELDEFVSGVSIVCKQYSKSSTLSTVKTLDVPKGKNVIKLDKNYANLRYEKDGTTIYSPYCDCIITEYTADATITIKGYELIESEIVVSDDIESTDMQNVKTFGTISIWDDEIIKQTLSKLIKWFALRQKVSMSYLVDSEKVGEWIGIQSANNTSKYAVTCINAQSIDLTGGFIATADCRGYSDEVSAYYEMGNNELSMAQEEVI